jgi:ABC-type methionine transport system ATPase subunit
MMREKVKTMSENITLFVELDYPLEHVKDPILYHLVTDYHLVPNIRQAKIDVHTGGRMVLRLEGKQADMESAIAYLREQGVTLKELDADPHA